MIWAITITIPVLVLCGLAMWMQGNRSSELARARKRLHAAEALIDRVQYQAALASSVEPFAITVLEEISTYKKELDQ